MHVINEYERNKICYLITHAKTPIKTRRDTVSVFKGNFQLNNLTWFLVGNLTLADDLATALGSYLMLEQLDVSYNSTKCYARL